MDNVDAFEGTVIDANKAFMFVATAAYVQANTRIGLEQSVDFHLLV